MFIFSNKEQVMQKRFCLCGYSVWVHYLCVGRLWQALFADGKEQGTALRACPGCGLPLSIHSVR